MLPSKHPTHPRSLYINSPDNSSTLKYYHGKKKQIGWHMDSARSPMKRVLLLAHRKVMTHSFSLTPIKRVLFTQSAAS